MVASFILLERVCRGAARGWDHGRGRPRRTAANTLCFASLSAYRSGDSNMRSVWLCSRNDLIGNCAVLASAVGVARTGCAWPDVLVAAVMAALALQGAAVVITQARAELAGAPA